MGLRCIMRRMLATSRCPHVLKCRAPDYSHIQANCQDFRGCAVSISPQIRCLGSQPWYRRKVDLIIYEVSSPKMHASRRLVACFSRTVLARILLSAIMDPPIKNTPRNNSLLHFLL